MEAYPGIRKLQQISSALILSAGPKSTLGKARTGLLSAPAPQKNPEGKENISTGLRFRFRGLPGSGKIAKSRSYPGAGNAGFTFPGGEGTGMIPGTSGVEVSGKGRSELMHAGGSTHKSGRQELVYGSPQTLLEEVKQIKEIVFETKEAVADHFESHLAQAAGKEELQVDLEHMSEKIMRMIDRRLKIEVERRGIF